LPPCVAEIIDRALEKRAEDRFIDGTVMSAALKRCGAEMDRPGTK